MAQARGLYEKGNYAEARLLAHKAERLGIIRTARGRSDGFD